MDEMINDGRTGKNKRENYNIFSRKEQKLMNTVKLIVGRGSISIRVEGEYCKSYIGMGGWRR